MIDTLDAEIDRRLAEGSAPGIAVAVTDRDGMILERTYGLAEVVSARPVPPTHASRSGRSARRSPRSSSCSSPRKGGLSDVPRLIRSGTGRL